MNVLSLFDGMSCGQIALERAGIKVDNYFASEIDKHAITVTMANYPNTQQLGDITKISATNLPKIDLLIGGSPCQGFSFAGKQLNFDDPRSKLFFEFVRLLNECKPKYFLLENVKMKKEFQDVITTHLGVLPITLNSSLLSAQNRVRLYWTNIPNIDYPLDKGIILKDILIDNSNQIGAQRGRYVSNVNKTTTQMFELRKDNKSNSLTTVQKDNLVVLDKYKLSEKAIQYMSRLRNDKPRWEYHSNPLEGKAACLTANMYKGVPYGVVKELLRRLTPIECERLQTVPDNYTNHVADTHRYHMLGNGWTIDIISHIFSHLKQ
jgi:DNA-cytosine methyltransferase